MNNKLVRITGSGFVKTGAITDGHPIEFRHWQEVVDEADSFLTAAVHSEDEEAIVELWLENPQSFHPQSSQSEFTDVESISTPSLKTGMVRRADSFGRKQAVMRQTNWDQEFADAQAHVQSVLKNMGNGR